MSTAVIPQPQTTYKRGTLEYTKRGLVILFIWLLWGDFCFTLKDAIEPSVLPLMLKDLGASNFIISLYVMTLANVFNMTICPIASFKSDRFRSKWGRRIPFMAIGTPFVGLFLILTGYSREIGQFFFAKFFQNSNISEATVIIGLIGILVVGYQFFNMIASSVYYYLFNDVVPEEFLGRFMALFRVVGTIAGTAFSFFAFPYARTHGKEIFVWFGILYLVGFMAMCFGIKEGEYPPPPPIPKKKGSALAGFMVFFRESFCHKFYWYFYLSFGFQAAAGCIGAFGIFRNLDIGLSMKEMGMIAGVTGIVTTVLLIPSGHYVDKKHPIRVMLMSLLWQTIFIPLNFIFLWRMSHAAALIWTIVITALTLPFNTVANAAEFPMFMRLLPRSRYGQFCSANALVRSAFSIVGALIAGLFVDGLKIWTPTYLHQGGDYYYRLIYIWVFIFTAISLYYRVKLYRFWLALGGDKGYLPPNFEDDELSLARKDGVGVEGGGEPSPAS